MLKCKRCGRPLEAVMVEGVIHCECGTDNKIVNSKVVGIEDDKRSGFWEAPTSSDKKPTEKKEPEEYEGRDAEEKTLGDWFESYRQYYEIKRSEIDQVVEDFCRFTRLSLVSVIPRGRFKDLWEQFKAQGE